MSLRVRLLGTIIGAIVLCFIVSVVAARIVLQRDLLNLGQTQVANGASAFGGYWDSHLNQIKLLVSQDAVNETLRRNIETHNVTALQDQLNNIARTSNLSWLTVVDLNGKVIARANGPAPGDLKALPVVNKALTGETTSSASLVDSKTLAGEGLAAQAQSDIKGADGNVAEHKDQGLAMVAAAPISDVNDRTVGAIYGGVLLNHDYDMVDEATQALGGSAAILSGDAIISSTIKHAQDGTRVVDVQVKNANGLSAGNSFSGSDTAGGTEYLAHITPILDEQKNVIGAQWYGTPMSAINTIINNTTMALVIWGLVAAVLALIVAVPVVQRVSETLSKRSKQVRAAAKELGVAIVGSEVSGDHVAMTRAAVEKSAELIRQIATEVQDQKVAELQAVNSELEGDIIVIDTLSQEMSSRMQQAVDRVHDLNDVAAGLNKLVTGEAS